MPKSIGTLFTESRLIAKTINRITVEKDMVELTDWRSEAKLLGSTGGSCLSSTTLLVKGKHVPTYGIDGRGYGFLFDAEKCNIYDVSSTDSNSNRTSKLAKRTERTGVDLLHSNSVGVKTLDELSAEVNSGKDGQMNEVLLDAWKHSCVGLFVRKMNLESATPQGLKHHYQLLLEIALIQKYLVQAFNYPSDFKICQYDEKAGRLLTFPNMTELKLYASMNGINEKTFPKLFSLLDDSYRFPAVVDPITIGAFLDSYSTIDITSFRDELIEKLLANYEPFDARKFDKTTILSEVVDNIVGVSEATIVETIIQCQEEYRVRASAKVLSESSGFFSGTVEGIDKTDPTPTIPTNSTSGLSE